MHTSRLIPTTATSLVTAAMLAMTTIAATLLAAALVVATPATAHAVTDTADDLYIGPGETYTLGGTHSYNISVEIAATGTLYIPAYDGSANTGYLELSAPIVDIDGTIDGEGRGYRGSPPPYGGDGEGPGGGSNPGGGGGYGGAGGASGWGNPGGPTYGTDFGHDIQMGSGGAHESGGDGGNGGAMFKCVAGDVSITGTITCDGEDGEDVASMDGGGGGSGGGVYIQSSEIFLSGNVYARGGDGGDCLTRRGGGGGGGGRVKFICCSMNLSGGNYTSTPGAGGIGSQTSYNGQPGVGGVCYVGSIDEPTTTSITDVANDQGRQVRVSWNKSCLDDASKPDPVTHYTIWRRIDELRAGDAQGQQRIAYPPGDWDFVLDVPARGEDGYNAIVPTLADSNASGTHWSVYFVSGVTDNPFVYYDSAPDSGYSVDNLSPEAPGGFVLARVGDANEMEWDESMDADFAYFTLHRGDSEGFVPDAGNLVTTLTGTSYGDDGPILSFYKLAAVDLNDNISLYSLAAPDVTGIPDDNELALTLRVISPVNGGITVEYTLADQQPARLRLYDVAGRLVAERALSPTTEGARAATLADQSDLASGVYFVHLQQGEQTRVGRVVVLK